MGPVKSWPVGERPRERLLRLGPMALTDAELLGVLLGSGIPGKSAVEVGRDLTGSGWQALSRLSPEELCHRPGVGLARAAVILAAFETGRRVRQSGREERAIRSSHDVAELLEDDMAMLGQEQFRVILLNTKHHVTAMETVFIGGLSSVEVHPREVFRRAVKSSAAGVIAVHNHPSGDPTPSREDRLLTRRLASAGDVLGIPLLDHVVLGKGRHVSFREAGLMTETV